MPNDACLAACPKCGSRNTRPLIDLRLAKGDTAGLHRGFGLGSFRECSACSHVWELRLTTWDCRVGVTAGVVIGLLPGAVLLSRDWRSPLMLGGSIFGLLLGGAFAWAYLSTWRRQQKSPGASRGAIQQQ